MEETEVETIEKIDYKTLLLRQIDRIGVLSNVNLVKEKNAIEILHYMLKPYHDEEYKKGVEKFTKEIDEILKKDPHARINDTISSFEDIFGLMMSLMARKNLLLEERMKT